MQLASEMLLPARMAQAEEGLGWCGDHEELGPEGGGRAARSRGANAGELKGLLEGKSVSKIVCAFEANIQV